MHAGVIMMPRPTSLKHAMMGPMPLKSQVVADASTGCSAHASCHTECHVQPGFSAGMLCPVKSEPAERCCCCSCSCRVMQAGVDNGPTAVSRHLCNAMCSIQPMQCEAVLAVQCVAA